jgi:hypothetical protein
MQYARWIRAGLLALVWGYAASIWASISHHILGLPDLVPFAAAGAVVVAAWWSLRPRRVRTGSDTVLMSTKRGTELG